MQYVIGPGDPLTYREDGHYRWGSGRRRYICTTCNYVCGRKSTWDQETALCPNGHGPLASLDRRLRVPSKDDIKGWKKFWEMVKISDKEYE